MEPTLTPPSVQVLLVEDNPDHKELICELLTESVGLYQVEWLNRLETTEQRLQNATGQAQTIDVVLLDYQLQHTNSTGLLSAYPDIPFVVLTSYAKDELDKQLMELGAADFLAKDELTPALLHRTIRHAIERHTRMQSLLSQSFRDPLTGLYNRRFFMDELERHVASAQRHHSSLSLCFADLDHLKDINDRFGHVKGDEALACFANVLADSSRKDDICVRYAGDEFCILLPHTALVEAKQQIERLLRALSKQVIDESITLSASFGLAELKRGMSVPEFINKADAALYQAKSDGRNCVRISE